MTCTHCHLFADIMNATAAGPSTRGTHARSVGYCSSLDLEATPPFDYAHDHFGLATGSPSRPSKFRRRANSRFGHALKPGEFILGYPDENGPPVQQPQPGLLSRNGSFMAYRRLEQHVGAYRDFLKEHGQTPEEQELVAAKLMGRWRSGAPLVLAPDKDDPALGADPMRDNNFNYKQHPAGLPPPAVHPR
jgi:deferrochelatase/peroxidase EfeB